MCLIKIRLCAVLSQKTKTTFWRDPLLTPMDKIRKTSKQTSGLFSSFLCLNEKSGPINYVSMCAEEVHLGSAVDKTTPDGRHTRYRRNLGNGKLPLLAVILVKRKEKISRWKLLNWILNGSIPSPYAVYFLSTDDLLTTNLLPARNMMVGKGSSDLNIWYAG